MSGLKTFKGAMSKFYGKCNSPEGASTSYHRGVCLAGRLDSHQPRIHMLPTTPPLPGHHLSSTCWHGGRSDLHALPRLAGQLGSPVQQRVRRVQQEQPAHQ